MPCLGILELDNDLVLMHTRFLMSDSVTANQVLYCLFGPVNMDQKCC